MALSYRLINTALLVIIAALSREIYILNERLSEMTQIVQSLNHKIEGMEEFQKELAKSNLEKHNNLKDGNYTLLGISAIILTVVGLLYFGGVDPGSIADALNVSANQTAAGAIGQNNLNSHNLIDCLKNIKDMNYQIITEINVKSDVICSKINAVLTAITKGKSINSILSSVKSSPDDFE